MDFSFSRRIRQALVVLRCLSLDIVAGGVMFTHAVAHAHRVKIPVSGSIALGICIWLIYALDHWVDARNIPLPASTKRHRFYQQHASALLVAMGMLGAAGLLTLFYLPYPMLLAGSLLLMGVALYFLALWVFKTYCKEIFVALLYVSGIFLPTFSLAPEVKASTLLLFWQSIGLALINLLILSFAERAKDRADGHRSWTLHFGDRSSQRHVLGLFTALGLSLLVGVGIYRSDPTFLVFELIFMTMTGTLGWIYAHRTNPRWMEPWGWLIDFVFFFPALLFFC